MAYTVTVRAKITKTFTVDAADEDTAMAIANDLFTPMIDGHDAKYEQFVLDIKEHKLDT